jgi:hypothetical protein
MFQNHLSGDIIRHTHKILLTENPLEIFNFTKEWFDSGEYSEEEIQSLVLSSIKMNYEKTGLPLFCGNEKHLNLFKNINFLPILNIAIDKNLINMNYLFNTKDPFFFLSDCITTNLFFDDVTIKEIITVNHSIGLETFQWFYNVFPETFKNLFYLAKYSIEINNLEMLEWLSSLEWIDDYQYLFKIAIRTDRLDICKWIYEKHYKKSNNWYYIAIEYDNFEILKWMIDNAPNDATFKINNSCFIKAIHNEKLEILKYLYEKYKFSDSEKSKLLQICKSYDYSEESEIYKWILSKNIKNSFFNKLFN